MTSTVKVTCTLQMDSTLGTVNIVSTFTVLRHLPIRDRVRTGTTLAVSAQPTPATTDGHLMFIAPTSGNASSSPQAWVMTASTGESTGFHATSAQMAVLAVTRYTTIHTYTPAGTSAANTRVLEV